jgi:hypothetical protein
MFGLSAVILPVDTKDRKYKEQKHNTCTFISEIPVISQQQFKVCQKTNTENSNFGIGVK